MPPWDCGVVRQPDRGLTRTAMKMLECQGGNCLEAIWMSIEPAVMVRDPSSKANPPDPADKVVTNGNRWSPTIRKFAWP